VLLARGEWHDEAIHPFPSAEVTGLPRPVVCRVAGTRAHPRPAPDPGPLEIAFLLRQDALPPRRRLRPGYRRDRSRSPRH